MRSPCLHSRHSEGGSPCLGPSAPLTPSIHLCEGVSCPCLSKKDSAGTLWLAQLRQNFLEPSYRGKEVVEHSGVEVARLPSGKRVLMRECV